MTSIRTPMKAVLFDFGDTLVGLSPTRAEIVQNVLEKHGVYIDEDAIAKAYRLVNFTHKQSEIKHPDENAKQDFLLRFNKSLFLALGRGIYADLMADDLLAEFKAKRNWQLFPDAMEVLVELKHKGFLIGIVANWSSDLVGICDRLGITDKLSCIISSAQTGVEKPDPAIFSYAINELGTSAEQIFYVGNEYETDVIGARNANLIPVLIDRSSDYLFADCHRVESLKDIVSLIDGGLS